MNVIVRYKSGRKIFTTISEAVDDIIQKNDGKNLYTPETFDIVHCSKIPSVNRSERKINVDKYIDHKLNVLSPNRTGTIFAMINYTGTWAKNFSLYNNLCTTISGQIIAASDGKITRNDFNCEQQQDIIDFGSGIIHEFLEQERRFIHPELKRKLDDFLKKIPQKVFIPDDLMAFMTGTSRIIQIYTADEIKSIYT